METVVTTVGSASGAERPAEDRMLREDVVREILARLARGEVVRQIARELGVDRKTVKAWRQRGNDVLPYPRPLVVPGKTTYQAKALANA
jgi:transposase-like protein